MYNKDNPDISNIQVPQSFIQEILSETQPLKESREEIYPSQPQAAQVSEEGEIVKLLSLLFEEFDKLNARLDKIQESVNEMTSAGGAAGTRVGMLNTTGGSVKALLKQRKKKAY